MIFAKKCGNMPKILILLIIMSTKNRVSPLKRWHKELHILCENSSEIGGETE